MKLQKNWIEWTVFAIGLIVVAVTVGYLIVSAIRHDDTPPDIMVTTGQATKVAAGYRVPVTVRNDGHSTAEEVAIEVVLLSGQQEVASAELTFAFVPRKSERHGWVIFDRDPRCCKVQAQPTAFEEP
jgi:uncharacterized protein (TIGR02588 family)